MKDPVIILTSYIKNFTGNKDVDKIILQKLSDKDMSNLCKTNTYMKKLCKNLDDSFWLERLVDRYGKIKNKKSENMSWKNFYNLFSQESRYNLYANLDKKSKYKFYIKPKKINNNDKLLLEHLKKPKRSDLFYHILIEKKLFKIRSQLFSTLNDAYEFLNDLLNKEDYQIITIPWNR